MRVSCSCLVKGASENLVPNIRKMGLEPIITNQVIRVVYDGKDKSIGEAIVRLFADETDHDVYVHYAPDEIEQYQPIKSLKKHPRSSDRKKRKKR